MKDNKLIKKINLLEGDILKNLIYLSAPLMATSFVTMAYNMIDTAWVGRLGSEAVAATGAAHFFIWIASSIGAISRVGSTVYISQEYGANHKKRLLNSIKNGIFLQIILMLLYTIFINLIKYQAISFYELETKVFDMALKYLTICSYGFVFSLLSMLFSNIYNSLGNSMFPFIANLVGMILNIFIDPILIFGFGPIKPMGIAGAALASIISQLIVLIIFIFNIISTKNEIYQSFVEGKVSILNMIEKFKKGLPSGLMSLAHALISLVLAKYMSYYGTKPIAAYSVGTTIESITWMTSEGMQGAIVAFVGQNFGAKLYDRLENVIKKSLQIVFAIGTIGSIIIIIFRYQLFSLFIPNEADTIKIGAMYLFIIGLSQMPQSMELGISGILNGLGETRLPAIVSIIFNGLRIPMALIFMKYYDFYGVWISMTISSILKGLFSYILLKRHTRKLKLQ